MKLEEQRYLPYLQKNFKELKDNQFSYSETVEII